MNEEDYETNENNGRSAGFQRAGLPGADRPLFSFVS